MTTEERRRANRLRVATGRDEEYVPPFFTGAELIAMNKLNPAISSTDLGKTQIEGGWRARKRRLKFGAGDAA